jgi:hypothetical protein
VFDMEGIERQVVELPATATVSPSSHPGGYLAVEVIVPQGGRVVYGMLGGTWQPDSGGVARIDVPIARTKLRARRLDGLRVPEHPIAGIAYEFLPDVIEGAASAMEEILGGSGGVLLFSCAAHGPIGSSAKAFGALAYAVAAHAMRTIDGIHDHELVALLEHRFGF